MVECVARVCAHPCELLHVDHDSEDEGGLRQVGEWAVLVCDKVGVDAYEAEHYPEDVDAAVVKGKQAEVREQVNVGHDAVDECCKLGIEAATPVC